MSAQPQLIGRLTKKYFNMLVNLEGRFLVTNWGNTRPVPIFADYITSKANREAQWKLIKEFKANGHICFLFKSREDFEAYRKEHPVPLSEYGMGLAE